MFKCVRIPKAHCCGPAFYRISDYYICTRITALQKYNTVHGLTDYQLNVGFLTTLNNVVVVNNGLR